MRPYTITLSFPSSLFYLIHTQCQSNNKLIFVELIAMFQLKATGLDLMVVSIYRSWNVIFESRTFQEMNTCIHQKFECYKKQAMTLSDPVFNAK